MTTMTREPHTATEDWDRREPSSMQLVLEIAFALDKLVPLAGRVAEIVDVSKPQLKFLSPDLRQSLDQAARDERAALLDTTGISSRLGLRWLRGRETDERLGTGRLPGRPDVISADAEIEFTLRDFIRQLAKGLSRAGLDVCVLPRLGTAPTVRQMSTHLTTLVSLTAEVDGSHLLEVKHGLEHLVALAQHVIHGAKTTAYGNCPHCRRPTITIAFPVARAAEYVVRCDADRTTNHLERCQCDDDACLCKYKPVTFRHEWRGEKGIARFKARIELAERETSSDASTYSKETHP